VIWLKAFFVSLWHQNSLSNELLTRLIKHKFLDRIILLLMPCSIPVAPYLCAHIMSFFLLAKPELIDFEATFTNNPLFWSQCSKVLDECSLIHQYLVFQLFDNVIIYLKRTPEKLQYQSSFLKQSLDYFGKNSFLWTIKVLWKTF
jgi:hypothetical protein